MPPDHLNLLGRGDVTKPYWVARMGGLVFSVLVVERGVLTKWHFNRPPKIILFDLFSMFEPEIFELVPGRALTKNRHKTDQS